jgi:hypothetical protein
MAIDRCHEFIGRLTAEQKLRLAEGMFWAARALEGGALAALHAEWSGAQIEAAVREAFLFHRD